MGIFGERDPIPRIQCPLKVGKYPKTSPSEDLKSYGELIKQLARTLGLSVSQSALTVTDPVYDIVYDI